MTHPNREEKIRLIAKSFIEEDPEEYVGETVEDVMLQIAQCSDKFIEHAYDVFVVPGGRLP
jgi:hypothetical protein